MKMQKSLKTWTASALALVAVVTAAADDATVYEVDVAADETRDLTADDVAAAAGKTLVKKGAGTLNAGDVMAAFAGDIRVEDGFYVIQTTNALGTAAGKTYVAAGGTLVNKRGTTQTNLTDPTFPSEEIHLAGAGCNGDGALRNDASCSDFARRVFLDGDARIVTASRFDFRGTRFNMNGHKLTVEDRSAYGGFFLTEVTIQNMGDIEATKGKMEFQSNIWGTAPSATVTMRAGTQLSMWNSAKHLAGRFVLEPGVKLLSGSGNFSYSGTNDRNILGADSTLELQGVTTNDISSGRQYQFRGPVTGAGGIVGGRGGYLQFFNAANTFAGGLDITGARADGHPVGGVVAYANGAIPHGDGAAPLKLTDASLQLRDAAAFALPAVEATGRVVVSNSAAVMSVTVPGLVKTGAEELTLFGPFTVTGLAAFEAGTVRLATRVPTVFPGLEWSYMNKDAGISAYTPQGVDATGAAYAYKGWPNGKEMGYVYTGYIRVPGEEGTSVSCNFVSSILRGCEVTIGGVLCAKANDKINEKDGGTNIDKNGNETTSYTRLMLYRPVTLTAGWQPITVSLRNWYNTDRGPWDNTSLGWTANFAIGVDWQGRGVVDPANYAKLLDPGDGSFLREVLPGDEAARAERADRYRASFAGGVACAPGVVLDLGDAAPYVPVAAAALTGLPTVRNGALQVASATWTLRRSDLLDASDAPRGQTLAVEGDARIDFPAGDVTVDFAAEDADAFAGLSKSVACDIVADVTKFPGVRFVPSAAVQAAGFRLQSDEGRLFLSNVKSLTILIR